MAHNKTNIDFMQGLRKWWHGLNEVVTKIALATSPLAKWEVVKSPLFSANGEKTEYCELVCSDNPSIRIGKPVHCETYGLINNADFLETIQNTLDLIPGAVIQSVGSVCGRGKIFVGISVPEIAETKGAGRQILPYLNFISSHDLSTEFLALANNHFVVCDNTLQQAIRDSDGRVLKLRVRHTKNAVKRLENIPQLVDAYCGTQRKFAAIMDKLADQSVTQSTAERFFAGFLTAKDEKEANRIVTSRAEGIEVSTRAENQRNRLVELFTTGKGNRGADRSDIFGSVTDYYSHESSGGDNAWRQIASSEFGSGQVAKERAFAILQDDQTFDLFAKAGDLILAAS